MAFCEAIARSIGVRGAAEECARERRHGCEQRLERGDRARPHAPAACRVERIGAKTLDGGDAQSVNRGLGENEPREGLSRWGQAEEGLGAAGERAFVGRPANVDVGDGTRAVEMSEPGAAGRALPQDAARGSRKRRDARSIGCAGYGEGKMMRTLILFTLLMAPFAVQALGQADSVSFRTVVATAGSCALPACTRKKWAKPAWATVAATGQRAQLLSSSLAWV